MCVRVGMSFLDIATISPIHSFLFTRFIYISGYPWSFGVGLQSQQKLYNYECVKEVKLVEFEIFFMQCKDFIIPLQNKKKKPLSCTVPQNGREGYGFLFASRNVNLF